MKSRYLLINGMDIPFIYDKKEKCFLAGNEIAFILNHEVNKDGKNKHFTVKIKSKTDK